MKDDLDIKPWLRTFGIAVLHIGCKYHDFWDLVVYDMPLPHKSPLKTDRSVYDWGRWLNTIILSQDRSIQYLRCKKEGLRSLLKKRAARRLSYRESQRCVMLLSNCEKEWPHHSAWDVEILFPLQGNIIDILYSKRNLLMIFRPLLLRFKKPMHETLLSSAWTCWETSSLLSLMSLSNETWIIGVNRSWMV